MLRLFSRNTTHTKKVNLPEYLDETISWLLRAQAATIDDGVAQAYYKEEAVESIIS